MALTGKTAQRGGSQYRAEHLAPLISTIPQGYGWQNQAEHLASTHAAVGLAAMAVARKARRRPSSKRTTLYLRTVGAEIELGQKLSKIELANQLPPTRAKLAEPERQARQETAAARILSEHPKTLAAHSTVADKGVAALESEPGSASEELVLRDNENHFLETPLDLIVNETIRLSQNLMKSDAGASDKGIAELERELGSAREELVHWENENRSLQTSLALLVGENSRLARCLTQSAPVADTRMAELEAELGSARERIVLLENENRPLQASLATADKARSQLEHMKTALIVAEAELNKLVFSVNGTNEKRLTEINTLKTRLGAMSSRAVIAENLLADARQTCLVRIEENSIAERKLADATEARNLAENELALFQNSLRTNERQVQELEVSRSMLIEGTNTLLKALKTRDKALARSEVTIKMLVERVAQLEAEANLVNRKKIEEVNSQLQCERMGLTIAEDVRENARTNSAELQRQVDNDVTHDGEYERVQVRSTQSLLADTISID